MAKIPLPERGQPLDVSYIYSLAQVVNDLSNQVSAATYNYTTVDVAGSSPQSIKTSDAKVVAKTILITNNGTVTAGNETDKLINFDAGFKFPPIIVATPVNTQGTSAGKDVSVVLSNITTTSANATVKFNTSGVLTIYLNVIAVGIPN